MTLEWWIEPRPYRLPFGPTLPTIPEIVPSRIWCSGFVIYELPNDRALRRTRSQCSSHPPSLALSKCEYLYSRTDCALVGK